MVENWPKNKTEAVRLFFFSAPTTNFLASFWLHSSTYWSGLASLKTIKFNHGNCKNVYTSPTHIRHPYLSIPLLSPRLSPRSRPGGTHGNKGAPKCQKTWLGLTLMVDKIIICLLLWLEGGQLICQKRWGLVPQSLLDPEAPGPGAVDIWFKNNFSRFRSKRRIMDFNK